MDEAIILAGGLGTRLGHITKEIPKPMAPINNKPFLEILLTHLSSQGIKKVILSVGYKKEHIIEHFKKNFANMEIVYSKEDEPLLTGGAIKQAMNYIENETSLVINGDTFFQIDFSKLNNTSNKDATIIALKKMESSNRYAFVKLDEQNRVIDFLEKKSTKSGPINGGVYRINKNLFIDLPKKFSFEEFLEKNIKKIPIYGVIYENYFIDIGVKQDYEKAQKDLAWL